MNVYLVETNPINVSEVVNNIQDMEDVEYTSVDKENDDKLITSTLYLFTFVYTFAVYIHKTNG